MKATKTSISLALGAALGASGIAMAGEHNSNNPFAMQSLDSGYMLAQSDKAGEGKCGSEAKQKTNEGKCGGQKKAPKQTSEGKCGGQKQQPKQAGEGKCGGNK